MRTRAHRSKFGLSVHELPHMLCGGVRNMGVCARARVRVARTRARAPVRRWWVDRKMRVCVRVTLCHTASLWVRLKRDVWSRASCGETLYHPVTCEF